MEGQGGDKPQNNIYQTNRIGKSLGINNPYQYYIVPPPRIVPYGQQYPACLGKEEHSTTPLHQEQHVEVQKQVITHLRSPILLCPPFVSQLVQCWLIMFRMRDSGTIEMTLDRYRIQSWLVYFHMFLVQSKQVPYITYIYYTVIGTANEEGQHISKYTGTSMSHHFHIHQGTKKQTDRPTNNQPTTNQQPTNNQPTTNKETTNLYYIYRIRTTSLAFFFFLFPFLFHSTYWQ